MKQVFFRCDASPNIGAGHVMRCITLAKAMKEQGWDCHFLTGSETETTVPALQKNNFSIHSDVFEPEKADVLIVDSYKLNAEYETRARQWAKHVVVIDDLADREHNCDLLIDQTFNRSSDDYKNLTPVTAKILTGSQYAILRSEFSALRDDVAKRRTGEIERVLVTFGATNIGHNLEKTILALTNLKTKFLTIDLLIGGHANEDTNLQILIEDLKERSREVRIYNHVEDMAKLMCDADLAIGAGGTTSWERCCLGLPTLMMEIAENQTTLAKNLASSGAIINLGWHEEVTSQDIETKIDTMLEDTIAVRKMSERAAQICDGQGTQKIIDAIHNLIKFSRVTLRKAKHDDADILLEWRNDKLTRKASVNMEIIKREDHDKWFEQTLSNNLRELYIAEISGQPIGTTRLDKIDKQNFEISWTVAPKYRGQGVGKIIVQKTIEMKPDAVFLAQVKKANIASLSIAKSSGMEQSDEKDDVVTFKRKTNKA